jgi:hypothetical protein
MEECRRLSQTLRTENARLKDQTLSLQSQADDLAERAVDDAKRLRRQSDAIAQLEQSLHAYQADRDRLQTAYQQLKSALASNGASNFSSTPPASEAAEPVRPSSSSRVVETLQETDVARPEEARSESSWNPRGVSGP